ncbi:hypothetical protein SALBM217S_10874 [Streptomyces griseoloalbus]
MPSMFSAREVAAERRFQGCSASSSAGTPRAVNQPASGQLPAARARARMASRGSFSTGLPSRQPAARPSQAASRRASNTGPSQAAGAPGEKGHSGHSAWIAARSEGSSSARLLGSSASSSSRSFASSRR